MSAATKQFERTSAHAVPSERLLRAALSGMFAAVGVSACDDNDSKQGVKADSQDLSNEELKALCADMVKESGDKSSGSRSDANSEAVESKACEKTASAKVEPVNLDVACKDKVEEAKRSVPKPDTEKLCAEPIKKATDEALKPKTSEQKTTNAEQKEYTFAALTKMCDDRGGYTEIHAACGGQNTCKGFSYGDWGPGAAMLTEHSCTGVNGCLGLSCVEGIDGKLADKSGADIYAADFEETQPNHCFGCHAESLDPNDHSKKDLGTFYVYVQPGSTRTADNWLDLSAAEQERKVFFGARFTDGHGRQIQNMAAYSQTLSRKEIEKVVAHIRTLKPIIREMKVIDP
ncbi:MAG TPA: hypothetical protein VFN67_17155 [Polyangiales bacterium]|jgi:hypothetical protein|nr:hypothetical protein [Polyangiales bacterium]